MLTFHYNFEHGAVMIDFNTTMLKKYQIPSQQIIHIRELYTK